MKHVALSDSWEWSDVPFPAYRVSLVYGAHKKDRKQLPVKDVAPVTQLTVTADYGKIILYVGTDKVAAEAAKAKYDAEQKERSPESSWAPAADMKVGYPTLPEGKFRVIKTQEKGTILVVPGDDDTNRCLLFVGAKGGFRGGARIVEDATTASILLKCSAANKCNSSIEVVALFEVGQSVAFYVFGQCTSQVYLYTWNGETVEAKHFSSEEWKVRGIMAAESSYEDAEVL